MHCLHFTGSTRPSTASGSIHRASITKRTLPSPQLVQTSICADPRKYCTLFEVSLRVKRRKPRSEHGGELTKHSSPCAVKWLAFTAIRSRAGACFACPSIADYSPRTAFDWLSPARLRTTFVSRVTCKLQFDRPRPGTCHRLMWSLSGQTLMEQIIQKSKWIHASA